MPDRPEGARGFDDRYWRTNYAVPEDMDGIVNADAHAAYVKAAFDVTLYQVVSVVDLGFGLGHLFEKVLGALRPYKALGIEPSTPAFEAVRFRLRPPTGTALKLEQVDLASWCRRPDHPKLRFDLGICTSVLQYLDDAECAEVVPALARRVRFLYLSVPTEDEYARLKADLEFSDPWAYVRPKAWYRDLFAPHFERVGLRLLESRVVAPADESPFTEDLFRGW